MMSFEEELQMFLSRFSKYDELFELPGLFSNTNTRIRSGSEVRTI